MGDINTYLPSLTSVADRIIRHVRQRHDTAFIGSPGCGITWSLGTIKESIAQNGFAIAHVDLRAKPLSEAKKQIDEVASETAPLVIVIDHASDLSNEQLADCLITVKKKSLASSCASLWCGALDARWCQETLGLRLCSVPAAHVTHPSLSRDELLSVYRAIASRGDCGWGDTIQYLLLDLCGSDLALVKSLTEYLHGDWSSRLSEGSVWDRIQDWLKHDDAVVEYRSRLNKLPPNCKTMLALIRFGGKPQCQRAELIEERDDGLRRLYLDGFIIPNLLPGYYQLRNLVVRFLLDESIQLELLFRRAANERAAALLQDTETMLRLLVAAAFTLIGPVAAREKLKGTQQPGEVIDKELNRALLKWAKEKCRPDAVKELNDLLLKHREEFKVKNSVWETINAMMRRDNIDDHGSQHIRALDYLTVDQLGRLVLVLIDQVFSHFPDGTTAKRVKEGWQEALAKVARLRNQVAHLRNVRFQDMEDLAHTLDRMRRDVIEFGGWKIPTAAADAPEKAVPQVAP